MKRKDQMPKFQRRHHQAIAELLRTSDTQESLFSTGEQFAMMTRFARLFEDDNPRFDRQRFVDACNGFPVTVARVRVLRAR